MYSQGFRPQPGQTKSGYYDAQGNWYVPAPGQAQPVQPQKRRASQPPRGPQPPRTPRDAGGKGRKPRKKRSLKWQLIKVLLVLILLAGAGVYGYIWKIQSDVRPYLNVFLDNVSVDGIDLSGLTWAEGSQLVWDHVNQKQNGWYVRLRNANGQYKDITAQTLGISFDPTAALNAAWAIGHDVDGEERKDIFQLKEEIEAAQNTQNAFFSAQQSANTAPIDEILQTLETAAYRAPSDAYIVSFNPDDSANPFTFQQEVYGQRLDTTTVRERILQMVQNLESGEVLLEPETIAPNVTVADLQKTVELRYRATTPISSASNKSMQYVYWSRGMGNGIVATPYFGWPGLLRTALIMIVVLLFLVDLVHSAPQAGSVRASAEKTMAGVRAVLALRGAAANRLRQRLLLKAGEVRKNEFEVDRAMNFHHLFLLK